MLKTTLISLHYH